MKPTKKQLKQIDDFLGMAQQVEGMVPKVGVLDSTTLQRVNSVKQAAEKARRVKELAGSLPDKVGKAANSLNDVLKYYTALVKQRTTAGMDKLENVLDKIDNAIIARAVEFLDSAKTFVEMAKPFLGQSGELANRVKQVEGWISAGQTVVDKLKKYQELLLKWANISKSWIDNGLDALTSGGNQAASAITAVAGKVGVLVAELKSFVENAKALGKDTLSDKVQTAEGWLNKAGGLLDKVIGILNILPDEQNINNIQGWYEKIVKSWQTIGGTGLLSMTKIDDKIIGQLGALLATAEKWMATAQQVKNQVLDKIVQMQTILTDLKKVVGWVQTAGDFLKDIKAGDTKAIFTKLQNLWNGIDQTGDLLASTTWDDALLGKIKELKAKADSYAKLAFSFLGRFGGNDAKQVDAWAKKALDIVVRMAQGEDVIGNYVKLAKDWAEKGFEQIASGAKKATQEVLGQATAFANEVKKFIAGASAIKGDTFSQKIESAAGWLKTSDGIFKKAEEIIGLVIGDKNENGLPDWYDKLDKFYKENLAGKDFLKGFTFDDKIIAKLDTFKKSCDEFLGKAQKATSNLLEKINNVKQWVGVASKALEFGAGIVQKFENKDWLGLYEEAVNLYKGIDNLDDILKGTKLDNKAIEKLKEAKSKAETWLINGLGKVTGGDVNMAKEIISVADQTLRFLLTRHEVQDFSQEFSKDRIIITPITDPVSKDEETAIINRLVTDKNATLRVQVFMMLKRIGDEIAALSNAIDKAHDEAVKNGYEAAATYKGAKKSYDDAMKAQNETVALITSILSLAGRVLLTALTTSLGVPPTVISGIETVFTLLSEIDKGTSPGEALAAALTKLGGGNSVVSMITIALPMLLPAKLKQNVEFDMEQLFKNGLTAKYEYVKKFTVDYHGKIKDLLDRFDNMSNAGDDAVKPLLSVAAQAYKEFDSVRKQITKSYIESGRDRLNEERALHNFSAALYSHWMVNRQPRTIRGEDPLIVKEVIREMRKWFAGGSICIMAGVQWDENSVGGKVSRFFGWLLGDWCTPGHKEAVKKMKANAQAALSLLSSEAAWKTMVG